MQYLALACDYDGTLASDGRVDEKTIAALEDFRNSGRKPVLVTGRELDDLLNVFPRIHLFDRVVAENGALLYRPTSKEEKPIGEPPPEKFVRVLQERGIPVSVGRVIVATWRPHETKVSEVIDDLGLELEIIFNKEAVMVLPSGVNKVTGLQIALDELGLSPQQAIAVGDAENDLAFLDFCGYSVAVANALPMVKEKVDLVTEEARGAGVCELIERFIGCDR